MNEIVQAAFRDAIASLPTELALMPLSRWNESVFRFFFCRLLADAHPEVEQFVECERIDLVLAREGRRAFVEFKFYLHVQRFDPYAGTTMGFKGGPGTKNLSEFRACLDQLHARAAPDGLSKYVVLVYADPQDGRGKHRYSSSYGDYRHSSTTLSIRMLESAGPIETTEGVVSARLYEVD
jgi:hypothetical protein